jgi:TonB-dependent SusC/RagA subfamily outer membrane receptor
MGLPGVSILVKGTTTGTATNIDGKYSLNVPNDQATLVFSFIGYTSAEQLVGGRSVVDVSLKPDERTLTELVVTGYSIDSRRETTGAISTVSPKDLTVIPTGNIEQTLQGRVSGVTVITNGQPGTSSIIRVRGFGAFGGNEPLYIVDGVPTGSTDFLNPDDIESTTVLKDAAAASIYGARAANGVILITTKSGKKGKKGTLKGDDKTKDKQYDPSKSPKSKAYINNPNQMLPMLPQQGGMVPQVDLSAGSKQGAVGGQQVQVKPILSGGVRRTGGGPQAAYGQMQDMYYQARVQP